jgi:phosphatidylserine/phosphatidylglycerophosphate/cardiolipin synthase-like enzyme
MNALYRRIFKSQQTGVAAISELLQSMFVGELLLAGESLWLVSPWVSNIVLIDNRSGNFDTLNPEWSRREIRLIDVLLSLMSRGSHVSIVTRRDEINVSFINGIRDRVQDLGLSELLKIEMKEHLHTKGILLSKSLLTGSMNLTYSGLVINDECIIFSIDPDDIARTRLEFEKYLRSV